LSATPCGVGIALDRQEKGLGELSAVQEVEQRNNIPVCAIANLNALLSYIANKNEMADYLTAIEHYRNQYGTQ